jgi:hypothetical protein
VIAGPEADGPGRIQLIPLQAREPLPSVGQEREVGAVEGVDQFGEEGAGGIGVRHVVWNGGLLP